MVLVRDADPSQLSKPTNRAKPLTRPSPSKDESMDLQKCSIDIGLKRPYRPDSGLRLRLASTLAKVQRTLVLESLDDPTCVKP